MLQKEELLESYAQGLDGSFVRPLAMVFPESKEQIVALVAYANERHIPLFTLSKGKNWGYGAAQGSSSEQLIINLSRFNKIIHVDSALCTMTLQPGVSQLQAYQYLQENEHLNHLQLDVTGAGEGASVVGNILERGFGHTDYGDRFKSVISVEVILGTGQVIRTGFAAYKDANAANTFRYGLGPVLDGLFTQSNFGIITEMTIELMVRPEVFMMFVCVTDNTDGIYGMVEAIRKLRLNGTVHSTVHMANKSRIVGEKENSFVKSWGLSGSISGPKHLIRGRKREVKKILREKIKGAKVYFFGDRLINIMERLNKIRHIPTFIDLKYIFYMQKGIPSNQPLNVLMDSKANHANEVFPKDFSKYFMWLPITCRADRESVKILLDLLEEWFKKHNYQLRITFTSINPRSLTAVANFSYEKTANEEEKARNFYHLILEELMENGFYPYRCKPNANEVFKYRSDAVTDLLRSIKKVVDPNGILAPGKYGM